jgi:hypothetical protein
MKKKTKVRKLVEPSTDEGYEVHLKKWGYELVDHGSSFSVVRIKTKSSTTLGATDLSNALMEAWHLVRPE